MDVLGEDHGFGGPQAGIACDEHSGSNAVDVCSRGWGFVGVEQHAESLGEVSAVVIRSLSNTNGSRLASRA